MVLENKLFIHKFQPFFFKDYAEENENEIIKILNTLILMDNLNLLLVGDIASGKTTLLKYLSRRFEKSEDILISKNASLLINN